MKNSNHEVQLAICKSSHQDLFWRKDKDWTMVTGLQKIWTVSLIVCPSEPKPCFRTMNSTSEHLLSIGCSDSHIQHYRKFNYFELLSEEFIKN